MERFVVVDPDNRNPPPAAVRCFAALFEELKHNNSIKRMTLGSSFLFEEEVTFDLRQFLLNNRSLGRLSLHPGLGMIFARGVSSAIVNVPLKILECSSGYNESLLDPIVLAYTKVNHLKVWY